MVYRYPVSMILELVKLRNKLDMYKGESKEIVFPDVPPYIFSRLSINYFNHLV